MIRQLEELLGIIPLAVGARMKSTGVWEPSLPVLPTVIFKQHGWEGDLPIQRKVCF